VSDHREEGIAKSSRKLSDGLCRGGLGWIRSLLVVMSKLVSEHREEGIAKSSRNLSDGLCRGGLGWITSRLVGYE
jgi:hypothetical protein